MIPNFCLFCSIFLPPAFVLPVVSADIPAVQKSSNKTAHQLLNNSDLVVVNFVSKGIDLEFQINIDLKYYNDLHVAGKKGDEERAEVTAQKFSLGFDAGKFIDLITIKLLPTEEHEEGMMNMEAIVAESVQVSQRLPEVC